MGVPLYVLKLIKTNAEVSSQEAKSQTLSIHRVRRMYCGYWVPTV